MKAKKYISRNGTTVPIDTAMQVAALRMKGYTTGKIAELTNLTEAQVVALLNVNRD